MQARRLPNGSPAEDKEPRQHAGPKVGHGSKREGRVEALPARHDQALLKVFVHGLWPSSKLHKCRHLQYESPLAQVSLGGAVAAARRVVGVGGEQQNLNYSI